MAAHDRTHLLSELTWGSDNENNWLYGWLHKCHQKNVVGTPRPMQEHLSNARNSFTKYGVHCQNIEQGEKLYISEELLEPAYIHGTHGFTEYMQPWLPGAFLNQTLADRRLQSSLKIRNKARVHNKLDHAVVHKYAAESWPFKNLTFFNLRQSHKFADHIYMQLIVLHTS